MISLPLRKEDMETILSWRSSIPETLRTPYPLTLEMQESWFNDVICNRDSKTRYTGFWEDDAYKVISPDEPFVGYGGIENISFENGNAEISLCINQRCRGKGYGKQAVDLILDTAFNRYRLLNVWGECYYSSTAVDFWKKIVRERDAFGVDLPGRKFFDGRLWGSYYFNFARS